MYRLRLRSSWSRFLSLGRTRRQHRNLEGPARGHMFVFKGVCRRFQRRRSGMQISELGWSERLRVQLYLEVPPCIAGKCCFGDLPHRRPSSASWAAELAQHGTQGSSLSLLCSLRAHLTPSPAPSKCSHDSYHTVELDERLNSCCLPSPLNIFNDETHTDRPITSRAQVQ